MNYSNIEIIADNKRITIPQLAERIGMTKSGLYRSIEKETVSIKTIEKISEVLGVPVTIFFEDENEKLNKHDLTAEVEALKKEFQQLWDTNEMCNERLHAKQQTLNWIYFAIKFDLVDLAKTALKEYPESDSISKLLDKIIRLCSIINKSERFEREDQMEILTDVISSSEEGRTAVQTIINEEFKKRNIKKKP